MAKIRIHDLHLRTIIGTIDWERNTVQDIFLNIEIEFNETKAIETDSITDTVDYKAIKKRIMKLVESSHYHLLEKLAASVLKLIMEDDKIISARVRIDKPHALRFARSVSIEIEQKRS